MFPMTLGWHRLRLETMCAVTKKTCITDSVCTHCRLEQERWLAMESGPQVLQLNLV